MISGNLQCSVSICKVKVQNWQHCVIAKDWNHLNIQQLLFIHSVMFDSLQPHALQHTRLPCPSPPPGVWSNSCLLSPRYFPTISSFVIPFSSCLQSFPASGSFPMSHLFASGGQKRSFSVSINPSNDYSGSIPFRIDWFDLLAVQGTFKSVLWYHN